MILASTIPRVATAHAGHFFYDAVVILLVLLIVIVAGWAVRVWLRDAEELAEYRRARRAEHLRAAQAKMPGHPAHRGSGRESAHNTPKKI